MKDKYLGFVLLVVALLTGCATPERVILLPEPDGSQSAVVVQARQGGEVVLDRPYAVASVRDRQVKAEVTDEKTVQMRYKYVMEALPARARSYTLNFEFGNAHLTAESKVLLDNVLNEMVNLPAPEFIIIGHADDVGSDAINDKLSLDRANSVLSMIKMKGITLQDVTVVGRGKRDPLYRGRVGVREPRNRRVEIRIK